MSYQFVIGFCLGAYAGTRYDLAPWIDKLESTARKAVKDVEKKRVGETVPPSKEGTSSWLSWMASTKKDDESSVR